MVVEVSVSDTGIGIDPAIVSKLFRPYAQAAVSTMREYPLFIYFYYYVFYYFVKLKFFKRFLLYKKEYFKLFK